MWKSDCVNCRRDYWLKIDILTYHSLKNKKIAYYGSEISYETSGY